MNKKIVFEKTYSRDITFLLASSGFYHFPEALVDSFDPVLSSPVLKYVKNGVVEFWLNKESFDYWNNKIKDSLLTDSVLFEQTKKDYTRIAESIRKLSEKKDVYPKDVLEMCRLFNDLRFSNHVMFISSMTEEWPDDIRSWSKEQREGDDLWSLADDFIRRSLVSSGLPLEQVKVIQVKQLIEYIEFSRISDVSNLFVEDCAANIYPLSIEKLATEKAFELTSDDVVDAKEISGQIGYKGTVIGKVKIVYTKEDLSKVLQGDILVSPMTTPDFLPAMKLAGAFVTDEGGLLCHAAIVSREMKIPCVIGTKIATQLLKDGDIIEVDANRGIIRKIT